MPRPPLLVFIACSLDGFIARPDGGLDWLSAADSSGEDFGYDGFMERVDHLLMGRGTFEKVAAFPEWPYRIPVTVLSRTLRAADVPAHLRGRVSLYAGELGDLWPRLSESKGVYVDGGQVIQSCLQAGWLDELTITRLPVLLGQGLPLFGPLAQDVRLRHLHTRSFGKSGAVQSVYGCGPAASRPDGLSLQ